MEPRKTTSSRRAVIAGSAVAASGAATGFVANVLISRELGPLGRGEVAFVLQSAYLIAPMLMLGGERFALRLDSEASPRSLRHHLALSSVVAGLLLLAVFNDWRALAAPVAYATSWLALARSAAFRTSKFQSYINAAFIYNGMVLIGNLVLFFCEIKISFIWVVPYLLPGLFMYVHDYHWRFWGFLIKPYCHVRLGWLQQLPGSVASIFALRGERILLPFLAGNANLGIYVAVATATESIVWIAGSLADHRVSRSVDDNSVLRPLSLLRDIATFIFIAAAIGFALRFLLIPLVGSEYAPALTLILPLSIASVILAVYRQVVSWLLAGPAPGYVSAVEIAMALSATPLYWFAISNNGALGAAWATGVVYLIGILVASVAIVLVRRRHR